MLKQISIYAENKKGCLQNITGILCDSGVNILGSVTNDSAEYGIVRMVVSNPEKSIDVLGKAGYICKTTPVLAVECPDEVGSLDKILKTLYSSNINVNYTYLSFNRESGLPIMVIHTDDTKQVENILINKGYNCI
ncbi:amino acid-binding protein [Butyrivibrio sp. XB500-5]|uniref:amino acid-binding protein n=1 Tax=Butyrivibrio sp. XB500-5 TaxID=2364880 RepID=UPI000EA96594|nr:amino acid-binding protein [Butyrivibrio sp. XB500-5]RKM56072.1 amino acid-binding protein [Butyrivibrio sp. XB500-5]